MKLPTGDAVQVSRSTNGDPEVTFEDTQKNQAGVVRRVGDKVYVLPLASLAEHPTGAHDPEAFEVMGPAVRNHLLPPAPKKNGKAVRGRTNATVEEGDDENLRRVEVSLLDRQGNKLTDYFDFAALRVAGGYNQSIMLRPDGDGITRFDLGPGTWIFYGEYFTTNGDRGEIIQYLMTDVKVAPPSAGAPVADNEPVKLVMDGRRTVRASLDVTGLGKTHVLDAGYGFTWWAGDPVSSYVTADDRTDVYLTPTPSTPQEGLQLTQVVSRRRSDAVLTLNEHGKASQEPLDLNMLTPDDAFQGTRTVGVLPLSPGDQSQVAFPPGTLALARVGGTSGFLSGDDAVNAAHSRGALGAVLWSTLEDSPDLRPTGTPVIPVLTPDDPATFTKAIGSGRTGAKIMVEQWKHPVINLGRNVSGNIPEELQISYKASQLARVRQVFHAQPDTTTGRDMWHSTTGVVHDTERAVKFGSVRTDYVSPGFSWTGDVQRCSYGWDRGAWYFAAPRSYPAGQTTQQDWGAPVQRSSVMSDDYNEWVLRRIATIVVGYVSYWTDGDGHPSSPGYQEQGTWQISSEGKVLGSGNGDWIASDILEGKHLYELSRDVSRPSPSDGPTARVRTTWSFWAESDDNWDDPDNPWAGEVLSMLNVDPRIRTGPDNTVPSGSTLTFDVNGSIVGIDKTQLENLEVWTWAEGTPENERTPASTIARVDDDTFRVTVKNPKAPAGTVVGMRISAKAQDGLALDQTIESAYIIR